MHVPESGRAGVAAPAALAALIALALLAALFLEASRAELRAARASLTAARAAVAAEGALERGLGFRLDTAAASRPVGSVLVDELAGGPDSAAITIRLLQRGVAELRISVVVRSGGFRVVAGRVAYVHLRQDSDLPGELVLTPVSGNWWAATP